MMTDRGFLIKGFVELFHVQVMIPGEEISIKSCRPLKHTSCSTC